MRKNDIYTLSLLILLTIATALFSNSGNNFKYVMFIILGLSITKFLLVVFNFMELKKANVFWKTTVIIYLIIFSTILLIINT